MVGAAGPWTLLSVVWTVGLPHAAWVLRSYSPRAEPLSFRLIERRPVVPVALSRCHDLFSSYALAALAGTAAAATGIGYGPAVLAGGTGDDELATPGRGDDRSRGGRPPLALSATI